MAAAVLETVNVRKVYPGTVALEDVSLGFEGGKVHALVGKNGAGKSTLVKVLSGAVQPTSGTVRVDGAEVRFRSPQDAFHQGIATVYQELSLVPELTVGENILFGRLPMRLWDRWIIDWPEVYRRAQRLLDEIGGEVDVRAKVGRLGIASQQVVEIAKAMSFNPRVLVLDEPTSALAQHEVERLFSLIRNLAGRGVAVLYISHRLHELPQIADTVSALRDGKHAGTIPMREATPERLVAMMFGEAVVRSQPSAWQRRGAPVLEVCHLMRRGKLADVNLALHSGEVLGIAGMVGAGRTELLMSLFGAEPFDSGEIRIDGVPVDRPSPETMKRLGVALTPENRKEQALVLGLSTRDNLSLAGLSRIGLGGLIWRGRQRPLVEQMTRQLDIRVSDPERPVGALSGGNQQKVVVGNWLGTGPRIMLFDEPTRGIDVQAKEQIFEIIRSLSRDGVASIVVSSELEELYQVCHRILVLRQGRIVAEMLPDRTPLDQLFRACMEA